MKIGLTAASNGVDPSFKDKMRIMKSIFEDMDVCMQEGNYLYKKDDLFSGKAEERVEDINGFFGDPSVKYIFDLSGGDISNEILPYLDYEGIKMSEAIYSAYSDLSTVINAIYSQTGKASILYQIRNVLYNHGEMHKKLLRDFFKKGNDALLHPPIHWIQGNSMEGVIIGGNIRCFLKLAGTKYMPDFKDKILFLEAMSGNTAKIATYLAQLSQIGAFEHVNGIFLGTFTEMDQTGKTKDVIDLLKQYIPDNMPVVKTDFVGHGSDSKAIWIGKKAIITDEIKYEDSLWKEQGEKEIRDMYKLITNKLIEKDLSITTMESATSGQIASLITDTEGSSAILKGAFVTYSNEAKVKQGVAAETIEKYGVYSEETAKEMAKASQKVYNADISIGVTGTMGNVDPANNDSVPGQVYFAILYKDTIYSYYRELEHKETRLEYKLCVAGEVGQELINLLKKE